MEAVRAIPVRDPGLWILAAAFALLFGPLLPGLASDWSNDPNFSHGFLVPVLAGWLVLSRRDEIGSRASRPFLPGALLLGLGVLQLLVGAAAAELYLQRTAMVPVLGGAILLLWGPARAKLCVFPIVFVLFMIPPPMSVWNTVAFPLQLLASRGSELVLGLCGIDAIRNGNVIHLENCSLEVAAACSGLRSLVTLLTLGAILAEGTLVGAGRPHRWWSKTLVFAAVVPVAVAVNTVRVALTALAASRFGPEAASGWIHDVSGLAMFGLALVVLLSWRSALGWIESRWRASSPAS